MPSSKRSSACAEEQAHLSQRARRERGAAVVWTEHEDLRQWSRGLVGRQHARDQRQHACPCVCGARRRNRKVLRARATLLARAIMRFMGGSKGWWRMTPAHRPDETLPRPEQIATRRPPNTTSKPAPHRKHTHAYTPRGPSGQLRLTCTCTCTRPVHSLTHSLRSLARHARTRHGRARRARADQSTAAEVSLPYSVPTYHIVWQLAAKPIHRRQVDSTSS